MAGGERLVERIFLSDNTPLRSRFHLDCFRLQIHGYDECMLPRELTIIFEPGENGWWIATIPEIPGAFSQGKTRDEARENVMDAAAELMSERRAQALREKPGDADVEPLPLAR